MISRLFIPSSSVTVLWAGTPVDPGSAPGVTAGAAGFAPENWIGPAITIATTPSTMSGRPAPTEFTSKPCHATFPLVDQEISGAPEHLIQQALSPLLLGPS